MRSSGFRRARRSASSTLSPCCAPDTAGEYIVGDVPRDQRGLAGGSRLRFNTAVLPAARPAICAGDRGDDPVAPLLRCPAGRAQLRRCAGGNDPVAAVAAGVPCWWVLFFGAGFARFLTEACVGQDALPAGGLDLPVAALIYRRPNVLGPGLCAWAAVNDLAAAAMLGLAARCWCRFACRGPCFLSAGAHCAAIWSDTQAAGADRGRRGAWNGCSTAACAVPVFVLLIIWCMVGAGPSLPLTSQIGMAAGHDRGT